jgi:hypothetical protein
MAELLGIRETTEHGVKITRFTMLENHRKMVERIQAKARPEQVRQHPSHPEYRRPTNPWTQPLPTEKPTEIKNVAEEVKKQKPNKDYLELFEE